MVCAWEDRRDDRGDAKGDQAGRVLRAPPVGAEELLVAGHTVLIDQQYEVAGVTIVDEAAEVLRRAEPVVKVRELLPQEWPPSEGPPGAGARPDAAAIRRPAEPGW